MAAVQNPQPSAGSLRSGPDSLKRTNREFEEFFDAVWPRAQATVRRMGLSPEESEEVALDALAIAYDRWSRIKDFEYRQAWVLKVAIRRALRTLRKRRPVLSMAAPIEVSTEDDFAGRMALGDALSKLPRRQREVITLRYVAGLDEAEVAQALGIGPGSVKTHASRARAALRLSLPAALEIEYGQ